MTGQRLLTLESLAHQRKTRWKRVTIPDWYGEGTREIEIVTGILTGAELRVCAELANAVIMI